MQIPCFAAHLRERLTRFVARCMRRLRLHERLRRQVANTGYRRQEARNAPDPLGLCEDTPDPCCRDAPSAPQDNRAG